MDSVMSTSEIDRENFFFSDCNQIQDESAALAIPRTQFLLSYFLFHSYRLSLSKEGIPYRFGGKIGCYSEKFECLRPWNPLVSGLLSLVPGVPTILANWQSGLQNALVKNHRDSRW